jgi:valyl-tRNA synthetase
MKEEKKSICGCLTKQIFVDQQPIKETIDQTTKWGQSSLHSHEEGTAAPLPPHEAEKIWHGPSDLQKVYLDWLHHRLVWQMQRP